MTSELFYRKLLESYNFKAINTYISKIVYYIIDSKYREVKRIDKFLSEQLINPPPELVNLASKLTIYINKKIDADKTIINILKWTVKNIEYVSDKINFGSVEYWATALETFKKKKDDCDGINAFIDIIARLAGIHQYQLFCRLGYAGGEYHYYLTYFSIKLRKWFAIDGTYYADFTPLLKRNVLGFLGYYSKPNYIFNEEISFKII